MRYFNCDVFARDCVNLRVLQLRELGELKKLHKKWWYQGNCDKQEKKKVASLYHSPAPLPYSVTTKLCIAFSFVCEHRLGHWHVCFHVLLCAYSCQFSSCIFLFMNFRLIYDLPP